MSYQKKGYSKKVKKINRLKKLGHSNRKYGQIKYQGFGWRGKSMQLTTHPRRVKQFPREAKKRYISYGTSVFSVKGEQKVRQFDYLPGTPLKRQLGHPIALGDDIIVSLDFKPDQSLITLATNFYQNKGMRKPTGTWEDFLKKQLRWVSAYFFKKVINDGIKPKIHSIVPKCTGRLQKGMVSALNKSVRTITKFPHLLKINTLDNLGNPIYYANPVNNMPTEWLAHPPNEPLTRIIYHDRGPRKYDLFDPEAETDWYSKVIDFAQLYIKQNVGFLWKALVGLFGVNLLSMAIYNNLKRNMKFK